MAEHSVIPLAHSQTPLTHSWPGSQALPHLPQFIESFEVVVQRLPHSVCDGGQDVTHLPFTQVPPVHTVPHFPQFCGSLEVSVQTETALPQLSTL